MSSLSPGARLGPYEIVSALGAGGMGEVFRARDTRLGREVALKVLPSLFLAERDRLDRFEQEARATAALNHPNILVVHDVGSADGVPYVVSELLEGHTLRGVLEKGAVPTRKATDYGTQIANGLAAAHERGVLHRDLKPENIFITKDGRAKILDFGLAKIVGTGVPGGSQATEFLTDPGTVLGTAGYSSPEQVRGETVDQRSDVFSLGAILYEMFSGARAFQGKTPVDTLSAILKEDPPDLSSATSQVPPAIDRVIRRCLEKNPAERFQSAKDVTFALDAVSNASGTMPLPAIAPPRRSYRGFIAAAAVAAVAATGAYMAGSRVRPATPAQQPTFKQLTFRSGTVRGARFAPDGQTVVYGASWEGQPIQLFSVRAESPESSVVNLPPGNVLAIASTSELAISARTTAVGPFGVIGTLARAPLAGGAARELVENVGDADWSHDGRELAVVRNTANQFQIEFPVGTVLHSAPRWLSDVRLSPDDKQIAYVSHQLGGDEGDVEILEVATKERRSLSKGWLSIEGLAWAPGGREIWFTATKAGGMRALWAVPATGGAERLVLRAPQRLTLRDISADGRVLVTGMTMRAPIIFGSVRDRVTRDLSWFDWSTGASLSADARFLAFGESGEGAGSKYGVYLRNTDGSPAVRLGDGTPGPISPDGKWVATTELDNRRRIRLLPTGAGSVRQIELNALENVARFRWHPDSTRLVIVGNEPGKRVRSYEVSIAGGQLKPLTPEGVSGSFISPDGKWLTVGSADAPQLLELATGQLRAVAFQPNDGIVGWLADSRTVLVRNGNLSLQITKLDVFTGARTPLATLAPLDAAGVTNIGQVVFAPDGDHYAFNYFRQLSELYLVEGLR